MKKIKVPANTIWESTVGYSRAIRIDDFIVVAGTAPVDNDEIVATGNAYEQAKFIIIKIENTLKELNASLNDVIRTRIFVKDISKWEEIGKAHGEFFNEIKPVTTMIEVKAFVHPDILVEIEAEAIVKH